MQILILIYHANLPIYQPRYVSKKLPRIRLHTIEKNPYQKSWFRWPKRPVQSRPLKNGKDFLRTLIVSSPRLHLSLFLTILAYKNAFFLSLKLLL